MCGQDRGALASGADTAGFDCQSGFVLTQNNGAVRYCTEFCAVDGDCPSGAGLTRCVDVNVNKPNGGTQVVRACARP